MDSNGNETERQGLYTAPAVLGNDNLRPQESSSLSDSRGKEGNGNLVRPAVYVTQYILLL